MWPVIIKTHPMIRDRSICRSERRQYGIEFDIKYVKYGIEVDIKYGIKVHRMYYNIKPQISQYLNVQLI